MTERPFCHPLTDDLTGRARRAVACHDGAWHGLPGHQSVAVTRSRGVVRYHCRVPLPRTQHGPPRPNVCTSTNNQKSTSNWCARTIGGPNSLAATSSWQMRCTLPRLQPKYTTNRVCWATGTDSSLRWAVIQYIDIFHIVWPNNLFGIALPCDCTSHCSLLLFLYL